MRNREVRSLLAVAVAFWLDARAGQALAASSSPAPTPTPTPRPRLSGGFGRPAVTPAAPQVSGTAAGTGQSLADAVRAASEAKQRKESKPTVAITNQTLVKDPSKGRLTTAAPRTPAPTPRAAAGSSVAPNPTPSSSEGGEAEWRDRMHLAKKKVEDLKERVYQLEAEAKKLENDFYAWDDGQYRDRVIKPAWDKKKEELEGTRKELAQAEKDLAELPEKARKAGALPGWLRE